MLHPCSFQSLRCCALETWAKKSPGDLSFGERKVPVPSLTIILLACCTGRAAELIRGDLLGQMDTYTLRMSSCSVAAPLVSQGHIRNTSA